MKIVSIYILILNVFGANLYTNIKDINEYKTLNIIVAIPNTKVVILILII